MHMKKLKTYENYNSRSQDTQDTQVNDRIKEIVDNIVKTKHYFELLQDTTENVFNMFSHQIPANREAFTSTLYQKNDILGELIDTIIEILDNTTILSELDEVVEHLKNLETYTKDNMDNLLSGNSDENDIEEEEDDEEDDEDASVGHVPEVTHLKRRNESFMFENKSSKNSDIQEFLKKHKSLIKVTFKKGDTVYIYGIKGELAKKLNGRKCEVIGKTEDMDDCYDLHDPTISKRGVIKGMPSQYLSKEEIEIVTKPIKKSSKK